MEATTQDNPQIQGAEPTPKPQGTFVPMPEATNDGPPEWAKMPAGLRPPKGANVLFVRFRPEWTATPSKGERACICWVLTDAEEMLALSRARGSSERAVVELAKQMVRAVDGHAVDWSCNDTPGSIDAWWNEIGPKCRNMLERLHTQTHVLDVAERTDFFENCIALRAAG